jgi:hypothetical protein
VLLPAQPIAGPDDAPAEAPAIGESLTATATT